MIRIGVDVGGTNTDAVVMDGREVLAGVKARDDAGRDVGRRGGDQVGARRIGAEARGDRRRDDRHHAFHQRGRAAARSRADRRGPPRPARDRLAAADGRLAGRPRGARSATTPIWRTAATNSTAARFRRSTKPSSAGIAADIQRQGHSLGRRLLGVQPGQHGLRGKGRRDSRQGAPRRAHHAVERHRPHRPARARERGDHERVPARSRQARRRRVPRRARRLRDQGRASTSRRTTAR